MQLSKKEQSTTTVQEIHQVVKKKVTVTDKFVGFRYWSFNNIKTTCTWRMFQFQHRQKLQRNG